MSSHQRKSTAAQRPCQEILTDQGLDAALAAALLARNPLALSAAAGFLDNSLIAAALGLARQPLEAIQGVREVAPYSDPGERIDPDPGVRIEGERDGSRGEGRDGDRTEARNERRTGVRDERRSDATERVTGERENQQPPADGSGPHGRLDPGLADHMNHAFWRAVASGAEGMGYVNAARHMHHYLDNSGSPLAIDLDDLQASCSVFADNVQDAQQAAIDDALMTLDGADPEQAGSWTFLEKRYTGRQSYFTRSASPDWFYAVGGNTHTMTGSTIYTPDGDGSGHGTLRFDVEWNLSDRYNWDGGKSVDILGVTVNDEVLGRLHIVGLAREFDMTGTRTDTFTVTYVGQTPGTPTEPDGGGERNDDPPRTGRDDLDRERR